MFKDKKIGTKLAAGIGIMLGIFTLVIAISIFNMQSVNSSSNEVKNVDIPLMDKALNIDSDINGMMLEMRGYIYTADATKLEALEKHISNLQKEIPELRTFAVQSKLGDSVIGEIDKANTLLESYIKLKEEMVAHLKEKKDTSDILVSTVTVLYENVNKYRTTQVASFKTDLSSDVTDSDLTNRLNKIINIDEIRNLNNMARIYTAKGLEARDLTLFDKALAQFPEIYKQIDAALAVTSKEVNKQQLGIIKSNAETYQKGVQTLDDNLADQLDIQKQLLENGNNLLTQTDTLMNAVLKSTSESSLKNVNSGNTAMIFLIAGFIVALVVGVGINYKVIKDITASIRRITDAAKQIAVGDANFDISYASKDEIGELTDAFNDMKDNINQQSLIVKQIAEGNTNIDVVIRSNQDLLNISLQMAIENINAIIAELGSIIESVRQGDLNNRGQVEKFSGSWAEMIAGLNQLIEAFVDPIAITNEYVTSIGQGRIPEKITKTYYGDFNNIKQSLNSCIDSVNMMVEDTNVLINAALDGKLDTRADESRHQGDFKAIVRGVNKTLDAVIEPVQEASAVLEEFSRGNLGATVMGQYKGDHAVIKNAMNSTSTAISAYIKEITQVLNQMAEGNLNVGITAEYKGDFVEVKNAINNIIDSLNEVLGEINMASDQVATGSRQVAQSSQALSHGSTMQASSIEEITASMTEISEQTKENAFNASKANEFSVSAKDSASKGNSQMSEMVNAMKDINESSANISKIIAVIDEIAFQTNILALNAAVEAARAGQHGKGFAVVAEEVRNLAARSANAAKETTVLIENSVSKVEKGMDMATETARALVDIVDGVSKAANLVADIAYASNEQATAISQINEGIFQVSQVVQNNTATAEESAAASEEMTSQAQMLKEMVGRFKLKGQHRSFTAPAVKKQPERFVAQTPDRITISLDDDEFGKY